MNASEITNGVYHLLQTQQRSEHLKFPINYCSNVHGIEINLKCSLKYLYKYLIMRLMKYFVVNNSVGPNNYKQLNAHGKFSVE